MPNLSGFTGTWRAQLRRKMAEVPKLWRFFSSAASPDCFLSKLPDESGSSRKRWHCSMGKRPLGSASSHWPQSNGHIFSVHPQILWNSFSIILLVVATVPSKNWTFFCDTLAKFTLHIHSRREKGSSLSGTWHLQIFRNQWPSPRKMVNSPRRFISTKWPRKNSTWNSKTFGQNVGISAA